HLLHNPPNFFEMKTSLRKINTIENEISKHREEIKSIEHSRSRLFFTEEKINLERRFIFSGKIIY
ncbi:MAG: hypothetical protein ACKO96_48680, partial [Flammeovirgaceae bacterium]